jgi:serine protease
MKPLIAIFLTLLAASVSAVPIGNNTTLTNLSASTGNSLNYEINVPTGATNLNIAISGGSGDADLYVRSASPSTSSSYDCRPYLYGNNETCNFAQPNTATYFIRIQAYNSFSGLSLAVSYQSNSSTSSTTQLSNGQQVTNLQGSRLAELRYSINVPESAENLSITTSGGSGDLDLYVKYASQPSTSSYDCRPYLNGNQEVCEFSTTQSGTYYILVRGYSAFSGASLAVSYDASNGGSGNNNSTWNGFESYYSNAIGKSGSALLSALNEAAARNHNRMSYSQVWDALRYTDEDPNNTNNVILIYTGRSQSKTFTSSGNNDPDAWNREHSWPKSHGFPSSGQWAYTDIHHLRPSDASVNSSRGNKDYDDGGSNISEAPGNRTDGDSFEPRDEVKGDVARMMFYMDIRYNGSDNTGTGDLVLVASTGTSGSRLGDLCTLLNWHNQDPVSAIEIERHSRIVERQGNRNPFVDNPDWANQIWGSVCN